MTAFRTLSYERYAPWQRWIEIGLWLLLLVVNAVGNSITTLMDLRRRESDILSWEPWLWEISSGVVWLLLILPALVWYTRRFPMRWGNWFGQIAGYLAASVIVCLVHVVSMVAIRVWVYGLFGMDYDFGPWPRELFYEYLKDARSFAAIVLIIESYRWFLRRWQGEASLLSEPDEGPALNPVDRPDRFLVRKLGREFLIAVDDIEWLQASGNYVNLRVRGHDYPLRSTIAGIETRLDPERFVRVHRSYIVNLSGIASIEPLDSGDARLHLHDGVVLPCSRTYREALRNRVGPAG